MAEAITSQVKLDAHSIEPIPEQDKDSTGLQQMQGHAVIAPGR